MVILHSYVSLPEGIHFDIHFDSRWLKLTASSAARRVLFTATEIKHQRCDHHEADVVEPLKMGIIQRDNGTIIWLFMVEPCWTIIMGYLWGIYSGYFMGIVPYHGLFIRAPAHYMYMIGRNFDICLIGFPPSCISGVGSNPVFTFRSFDLLFWSPSHSHIMWS